MRRRESEREEDTGRGRRRNFQIPAGGEEEEEEFTFSALNFFTSHHDLRFSILDSRFFSIPHILCSSSTSIFNSRRLQFGRKTSGNTMSSNMFSRLFGAKSKGEVAANSTLHTLDKLQETLDMLEKKEQVLLKKAAGEVERAKEFTRAKNKRAAIQCLKRKRLYEQQVEQLGNFQLRIHDQMIMLEGAKATTDTVDALRSSANVMKAMQKATNIDDVDKTMDQINEQTDNLRQIQEALAMPIGGAEFDEDELEAELEELEGAELEEQLLQPITSIPTMPVGVSAGKQPARPTPQKNTATAEEDDELAKLQAELAL